MKKLSYTLFFRIPYYLLFLAVFLFGGLFALTFVPIAGNTLSVKIVQSGSMEPEIKTGSIVIIRKSENYQVGDVITFGSTSADRIPTTHRIISDRVASGVVLYTTQGDANNTADQREVREAEVIGKVLFSVPFVGYILDMARRPIGFILLIAIPAGFVLFEELSKIWREVRHRRRDTE